MSENQAEQTRTSHQVMLLNEMNSVDCELLENLSLEHLQEYQQGVRPHSPEVQVLQVLSQKNSAK